MKTKFNIATFYSMCWNFYCISAIVAFALSACSKSANKDSIQGTPSPYESCSGGAKEDSVQATPSPYVSCSGSAKEDSVKMPPFPYESYLEKMNENQDFPRIGDDDEGFNAISHKIKYPEIPAELRLDPFADSLLLMYNSNLAFNTIAYDVSSAERYIDERDRRNRHANALGSVNLSGIKDTKIRKSLLAYSKAAGKLIRKGKRPNEEDVRELENLYEVSDKFMNPFMGSHFSDVKFDPSKILLNYNDIHLKTMIRGQRTALLKAVLSETDFQKKCILAREFAYANYKSRQRNDKELIAIIDPILRSNEYSPLLYDLWLMWRTALQKSIFGSRSNDGAMYNLFYNNMRNHIAVVYITHLMRNPQDKIAFNKFAKLTFKENITRTNSFGFGNNSLSDERLLYDEF